MGKNQSVRASRSRLWWWCSLPLIAAHREEEEEKVNFESACVWCPWSFRVHLRLYTPKMNKMNRILCAQPHRLSCPVPISFKSLRRREPKGNENGPSDWPMGFVETLTLECLLRDRRDTPWHKENISTLHPSLSILFWKEKKTQKWNKERKKKEE